MKIISIFVYSLVVFFTSCLPKLTTPHIEKIFLGSLSNPGGQSVDSFVFECPESQVLHLVIKLNSAGLSDDKVKEIRSIWENNYTFSVEIFDTGESLVFSEKFGFEEGNISTGGNWMEPDISIILLKSIEQKLTQGRNYRVEVALSGNGLEEYSLDLFLNRVFIKS